MTTTNKMKLEHSDDVEELLELIKAWKEGATIQESTEHGVWKDKRFPRFGLKRLLRVKPEPKYRPFETIEEVEAVFGKVARHINGSCAMIISHVDCGSSWGIWINKVLARDLFNDYTIDGHPAGVEVTND